MSPDFILTGQQKIHVVGEVAVTQAQNVARLSRITVRLSRPQTLEVTQALERLDDTTYVLRSILADRESKIVFQRNRLQKPKKRRENEEELRSFVKIPSNSPVQILFSDGRHRIRSET